MQINQVLRRTIEPFFRPAGLASDFRNIFPALKGWAIFKYVNQIQTRRQKFLLEKSGILLARH
jgi:hypothetical protein